MEEALRIYQSTEIWRFSNWTMCDEIDTAMKSAIYNSGDTK